METEGTTTHEQHMESYALRQTKALETLRSIAWLWTAAAALGLLITLLVLKGA